METMMKKVYDCFQVADILLPPESADISKWAVIACDQYTSEPEYWRECASHIGHAPSTYRCILPEAFLSDATPKKIASINDTMRDYLYNYLKCYRNTMIYVRRTLKNGSVRTGIVGTVDLEEYDYSPASKSLIRATEGTVLERIPPRVHIRRGAPLELPHIMMLIDDPGRTVIEQVEPSGTPVYDGELYSGGHITGWVLDTEACERVRKALSGLAEPCRLADMYGSDKDPLIFAVGDGNHSLATAKTCWEEIKRSLTKEEMANHPARRALVELVNLHDASLEFEPIYRLVMGVDPGRLISALTLYAQENSRNELLPACHQVIYYKSYGTKGEVHFTKAPHMLTVGTLDAFLEEYISSSPGKKPVVDYIHGIENLNRLAESRRDTVGFSFTGMKKNELFASVIKYGPLPRKTFSMGSADDKRYYVEARRIKTDAELSV